ncbi:MAG: protein-glutamate O-methyltransferase CheR [Candidatus Acidiferrales bacterium]
MPTQSVPAREQISTSEDLRDPALVKIRDLIYRTSGIFQSENKFYLLANRCQRRMTVLGSGTFADYLDQLNSRASRDAEMRSLLNEITIGETCFFRNQPQLDAVTKIILPKLVTAKSKQAYKKIRMWSAGCSTGEEPFTLALLMSEQIVQKLKGWTFEIMATDLNDNSLAKCREGLYSEYTLRNTSPQLREKYFTPQGELFRVRDEIRANIKFDRLNLQDQSRILFMKGFDIIFCCNVLIYFDAASKKRTVEHFYSGLLPGGHFFLGHAESLYAISEQFRLVHFPDATAYRKPAPGDAAATGGAQ